MMEHHINNSIRQKILRELALRVQNVVSEFLSTSSNIGYSPWQSKLHHILTLVERNDRLPSSITRENSGGRCFLFLRCEDVLAMAKSLIATPQPESSSTSVFERTPSSSSSTLANQLPNKPGIVESLAYSVSSEFSTMASQTWHNSRPFLTSIYDTIGSTTTHNRPNSSGTLVVESEKQSSLSFIHDLWVLNASRDFQLPGSSKNEVAVVFTREDGDQLSLQPFRVYSNAIKPVEFTTILSTDDQTMLTTAVLLLAERTAELQRNHSAAALASLKGLIDMLRDKLREANDAYDFQAEYFWSQCLDIILNTKSNSVIEFLSSLVEERNARITYKRNLAKEYDDWLHVLRGRSNTQDQQNQRLSLSSKRLRNKMWYVSDIRHSSAYEDACNVIRALRAMIEPVEHRPSGVAGWAKQRFRSSYGQERTLAQLLELMTAPKTYGGPNKLSENQVEITSGWLLHDNVENFCGGEERIHRFCYEIQKCVKRLAGEAMLDSPVLWSSPLYTNEKSEYGITGQSGTRHQQDRAGWRTDFSYPQWPNMQPLPGQPSFPSSDLNSSTTSPTRPTFDHPLQSPFQPMIPPNSVGPQGSRNWMLPPSPISPGNVKISQDGTSLRRRSFLQNLRIHLTSLLLSDLGSSLWNHGTETDRWISALDSPPRSSPVISQYTPQMDLTENPDSQGDTKSAISVVHPSFNFIEAQQVLLQRFRLASNPQMKLQYLHELFMLLRHARQSGGQERFNHLNHTLKGRSTPLGNIGIGNSVPRTRLTRLQEVAANCEDRRISSVINSRCGPIFNNHERVLHGPDVDDSELITALQDIFEDSSYRPPAFFRDLQYIAAFTPSSILDHTPQGTAFWTVGLAAMRIKSEKSKIMTDNAMQILEYHYGNGGKSEPIRIGQSSPRQGSITTSKLSQQDLLGTTLQDAARMLTVSALEGDPTAARELALFHLTHPELVSRVTLPLSRPSDIFRAKNGIASERGNRPGNQDSGILDSVTFAVVYHWMEFAANAGDVDAITFFKDQ